MYQLYAVFSFLTKICLICSSIFVFINSNDAGIAIAYPLLCLRAYIMTNETDDLLIKKYLKI